jgi:hypothetical protein
VHIASHVGNEPITVRFAQRIHPRVTVLLADPAVNISMPTIKARLVNPVRHQVLLYGLNLYAAFRIPMLWRTEALPPPRSSVMFQ